MPRTGMQRRAHSLGDGPRLIIRKARQDDQQFAAAPSNREIRLANRAQQGLGDGLERGIVDAGLRLFQRGAIEQDDAQLMAFATSACQFAGDGELAAAALEQRWRPIDRRRPDL